MAIMLMSKRDHTTAVPSPVPVLEKLNDVEALFDEAPRNLDYYLEVKGYLMKVPDSTFEQAEDQYLTNLQRRYRGIDINQFKETLNKFRGVESQVFAYPWIAQLVYAQAATKFQEIGKDVNSPLS